MVIYALFIKAVHARICVFHSVITVGFEKICIGFCYKRNYAPMREGKSQYTPLETTYALLSFVEGTLICTGQNRVEQFSGEESQING